MSPMPALNLQNLIYAVCLDFPPYAKWPKRHSPLWTIKTTQAPSLMSDMYSKQQSVIDVNCHHCPHQTLESWKGLLPGGCCLPSICEQGQAGWGSQTPKPPDPPPEGIRLKAKVLPRPGWMPLPPGHRATPPLTTKCSTHS